MIKIVLFAIGIAASLIILPAFKNGHQTSTYMAPDKNASHNLYLKNLKNALKQLQSLKTTVRQNPDSTQKEYLLFRTRFKHIEHWLAYLDEDYYVRHINGAPLPKLDHDVPRIKWFEPKGLQHLDELIYDDSVSDKLILEQIDYLYNHLQKLHERHAVIMFQNRFFYEATRRQLIRLYSLGITGFDTPGSVNAIDDCISSLQGMREDMEIQPELFGASITKNLDKAILFCQKQSNFEQFDRLTFLTQHIDPIYDQLLQIQKSNYVELPHQVHFLPVAVNYESTSLFSNSFLNKGYYGLDYKLLNLDKAKVEQLGKILFFDPVLSANNKMACVSCHQPGKGFSDGLPKSKAFDNEGVVERNSPTIINSVFADRFFHDLRADKLIDQPTHVIKSHAEFNTSYPEIVEKLATSQEYQVLFKEAFPQLKQSISQYSISHSLSAYVQSISGFNSSFDRYVRGESDKISDEIKLGYNLFMGKAACGTCHFAPTFSGLVPPLYTESESEILGVPADPNASQLILDADMGRYKNGLTKERADIYKHAFKTPTIRNIELTAPYMHNGSYQKLEEVLEFYNVGGGEGLGITVPYQTLPADSLHLTEGEINAIISFMNSLTDTSGMTSIPNKMPSIPGITRGRAIE